MDAFDGVTRLTRRKFGSRLARLAYAIPFVRFAALGQRAGVHRIGLAVGDDPENGAAAFKGRLKDLGYVEGRNLIVETGEGPRPSSGANVATTLASLDLELLVVQTLPLALAARAANPTMPLVIVTGPGLLSNGFANSVDHPGRNATGIDELPPGVTARRVELLKIAAPAVSNVGLLSTTPGHGGHEMQLADAREAAAKLGITVKPYRATSIAELQRALEAIAADGVNGLLNFQGGLSYVNRQMIVDFAAAHRIPAIYQATVFATAGGLMTWAPDLVDQFRMAADYVDRILKGANPGDLPIGYPRRYYLTLNNAAARSLGLVFPAELLAQADRILG